MSDDYDKHNSHEANDGNHRRGERSNNLVSELVSEIPIVGELFSSFRRNGPRRACFCFVPVLLIIVFLVIALLYWIIKSGLSLFKIDIASFDLIAKSKSFFAGLFPLDQISQWFGSLGSLLGSFGG